ncbi:hypothetical protein [Phenylobacterium sp.]|uniref:hypothetical protein n=1 Tax=Phenylobacterium sp. TaxID=1871053 RepID=UPI0030F3C403
MNPTSVRARADRPRPISDRRGPVTSRPWARRLNPFEADAALVNTEAVIWMSKPPGGLVADGG